MKVLWGETLKIWAFTFFKIPLLFYLRPRALEWSDERSVLCIPFRRRAKNHVNSMFFATLCAGADSAGGLLSRRLMEKYGPNLVFIYKAMKAEFHKRAEGDVHFTCEDAPKIRQAITKATETGERVNDWIKVIATVPSQFGAEPVATFDLEMSVKLKRNA